MTILDAVLSAFSGVQPSSWPSSVKYMLLYSLLAAARLCSVTARSSTVEPSVVIAHWWGFSCCAKVSTWEDIGALAAQLVRRSTCHIQANCMLHPQQHYLMVSKGMCSGCGRLAGHYATSHDNESCQAVAIPSMQTAKNTKKCQDKFVKAAIAVNQVVLLICWSLMSGVYQQ